MFPIKISIILQNGSSNTLPFFRRSSSSPELNQSIIQTADSQRQPSKQSTCEKQSTSQEPNSDIKAQVFAPGARSLSIGEREESAGDGAIVGIVICCGLADALEECLNFVMQLFGRR